MLGLLRPVQDLLQSEPVRVDNIVFRLHSRATVTILTVCAILVTAKQYFGEAITCIPDKSVGTGKMTENWLRLLQVIVLSGSCAWVVWSVCTSDKGPLNAYCWIFSTFTVSRHFRGIPGTDVASPGVGQALTDDEIQYHRYYQWVYFVLTFQAILFYTPRALWGVWEAGIIGHLAKSLTLPFPHDPETKEKKHKLVKYFTITAIHTHNSYALRFLICELLNFINVIGQTYLLNVFFDGQFTKYGLAVTAFIGETKPFGRVDPMAQLFPKVTKCTFHTIGASGSTQILDALCILPLNVVNEKIFIFIWFWLIFLAAVSALAIFYRIIVFSQPWARIYLIRAVARKLPQTKAATLVKKLRFGDWFLLYQLAYNVNPILYRELVNEIATALSDKCIL